MTRFRKIYKTRANEARIPIQLGDVTVDAHFVNGNIRDNQYATLETSDTLTQFVIESSPLFGKKIFLEDSIEIEEPKPEKVLTLEDVTSLQEAREYMVKNYGVNLKTIISPNALKSQMKNHQVKFPNFQP